MRYRSIATLCLFAIASLVVVKYLFLRSSNLLLLPVGLFEARCSMLKSGQRSAWPRWLCREQSMATFALPTDVCWKPVPQFVVTSKLPVWRLTRTPAFKAARRSLAGAVRQTLFQGGNGPELPEADGGFAS